MKRIEEIKALSNGLHRNQMWGEENLPVGYAVVPDDLETPNFPSGEVTVEEIDGVMTVTKWVAGKEPVQPPDIEETN